MLKSRMNPLEIIGHKFDDVEHQLEHDGIKGTFDDLLEGEKQEYSVSASDGTWEISLGKENRIKTIFLYLDRGCQGILGITIAMKRGDIIEFLGKPTSSGDEGTVPFLGEYGAWERYDKENYCIHIEHYLGGNGVKKITIMLPDTAP